MMPNLGTYHVPSSHEVKSPIRYDTRVVYLPFPSPAGRGSGVVCERCITASPGTDAEQWTEVSPSILPCSMSDVVVIVVTAQNNHPLSLPIGYVPSFCHSNLPTDQQKFVKGYKTRGLS